MKAKMRNILLLVLTVTMLAFCGVFMAACDSKSGVGAIDAKSLLYDGSKITWKAAKNAESYVLVIDGKVQEVSDTSKVFATGKDEVEITVYAIKGDKEGKKATRTFTRLPQMTTDMVTFETNGTINWETVEGADEYVLNINGTDVTVTNTTYYEIPAEEYTGKKEITIRPSTSDGSTFSKKSDKITKYYLAAPTVKSFDGATLTWNKAEQPVGYELYVTFESSGGTDDYSINQNTSSFTIEGGLKETFSVQMKAVGNGTSSFTSPLSESRRFVFLDIIDDLEVKDGILTWGAIDNAVKYEVKGANGQSKQEIKATSIALDSGRDMTISVRPLAQNQDEVYFSAASEEMRVYILPTPKDITWSGGTELDSDEEDALFSWGNSGNRAAGYRVELTKPDGEVQAQDLGEKYSFGDSFSDIGTYKFRVQAYPAADAEGVYASRYCDEYKVTRLASPIAPTGKKLVDSSDTKTNLQGGFILNWAENTNTYNCGYQIYKEGNKLVSVGQNVTSKQIDNVSTNTLGETITYFVQAVGKLDLGNKNIVLSSKKGTWLEAEVTVLPQPAAVQNNEEDEWFIEDQSDMKAYFQWLEGSSDYGYGVRVSTEQTDRQITQTNRADISNIPVGESYISVCSMGDGGAILPSLYTAEQLAVKLAAPTNLRVRSGWDFDYQLEWDEVQEARRYGVTANNTTEKEEQNAQSNILSSYENMTGGIVIVLRSLANEYSTTKDCFLVTSEPSQGQRFEQLAAPSFSTVGMVEGRTLKWTAPNAPLMTTSIRYVLSYSYTEDGGSQKTDGMSGERTQSSLDLADYKPGYWTFTIRALGNSWESFDVDRKPKTIYLDSAKLTIETIQILEVPDVQPFYNEAGKITGFKWAPVDGAVSYEVKLGDDTAVKWEADKPYPVKVTATKTLVVYAVGDGGTKIVNSTNWERKIIASKLDTPSISVGYDKDYYTEDGKVTVTVNQAIENASSYTYYVGGTGGQQSATEALTYSVDPDKKGQISVVVKANGGTMTLADNGKDYIYWLDSDETTKDDANPKGVYLLDQPILSKQSGLLIVQSNNRELPDEEKKFLITFYDKDDNSYTIEAVGPQIKESLLKGFTYAQIKKFEVQQMGVDYRVNGYVVIASAKTEMAWKQ